MLTLKFWKGTLIRATRTFAQGFLGISSGTGLGFWNLDWKIAVGAGLSGALGSVLMSIDRAPKDPSEDDVQAVEAP